MATIFSNSVAVVALKTLQFSGRGFLPQLRPEAATVLVIQTRGGKTKFGEITRDPFKTFQQKLNKQQQYKHAKTPLVSEERAQMKMDFPLNLRSLGTVVSDYLPLEKFAKAPLYTRQGLRQRWTGFKEGLKIIYAGAVIRRQLRKTDPFKPIEFARKAQEQFIETNAAIQMRDKQTLRKLTTEDASEGLKKEFDHKRFTWQLVEEVERPRVVNARVVPLQTKENLFAQVTVRMHSKQILAVYNTLGNVIRGHPTKLTDVIDYVVFERPLTKPDSRWRIAAKLPPQLPLKTARSEPKDRKLLLPSNIITHL